jgi:hypothetical protein
MYSVLTWMGVVVKWLLRLTAGETGRVILARLSTKYCVIDVCLEDMSASWRVVDRLEGYLFGNGIKLHGKILKSSNGSHHFTDCAFNLDVTDYWPPAASPRLTSATTATDEAGQMQEHFYIGLRGIYLKVACRTHEGLLGALWIHVIVWHKLRLTPTQALSGSTLP